MYAMNKSDVNSKEKIKQEKIKEKMRKKAT